MVNNTTVEVDIHPWDYVFSIAYALILLVNLVGVAKYAIKAQILTLMIMTTNLIAIACKY